MKKIILLLLSILTISILLQTTEKDEIVIPDNAIRFRVLANSNSIYDQNVKIQVRNIVQNRILELTKDSKTINDTRNIIKNNENEIKQIVSNKLTELNYDKKYDVNYGYNYFPNKKYKGINYKEGYYESLVITLGKGEGNNWWCVLFPPLCLLEADESSSSNAEYTFFVKELIDKYFK